MTWMPKLRQVKFSPKPDYVPDWVYTEAMCAKRFYNAEWELWVFLEAQKANVSQAVAEDACIRGIKTAMDRLDFIYGPKIAAWYKEFLDMGDLFQKVRHPEYITLKLDKGEG